MSAPDRLRFDFSHQGQGDARGARGRRGSGQRRRDHRRPSRGDRDVARPTRTRSGAIAFFGDKYGDRVRVVRAGAHSTELCGGTHVGALGMIGPVMITSESSIGAGTRRIEALTGPGSLALSTEHRRILEEASRLLRVEPEGLVPALDKLSERQRQAEKELSTPAFQVARFRMPPSSVPPRSTVWSWRGATGSPASSCATLPKRCAAGRA